MCITRFPETNYLDSLREVLPLDTFRATFCGSLFDETTFCWREKQCMLVNDECSSWYNRVGTFVLVRDRRKHNLGVDAWISMHGRQNYPNPECVVSGTDHECYDGTYEFTYAIFWESILRTITVYTIYTSQYTFLKCNVCKICTKVCLPKVNILSCKHCTHCIKNTTRPGTDQACACRVNKHGVKT